MAEPGKDGKTAAPAGQPNLGVMVQYVKDLSFENPGSPASLAPRNSAPQINIQIGVQSNQVGENQFEVELKIDARAVDGQAVLFAIELVYAGVFRLSNIPAENVRPTVLIQCPQLLFPFARAIIADASRNGGFPPLMID